jgi:hypothetical protein
MQLGSKTSAKLPWVWRLDSLEQTFNQTCPSAYAASR